MYRWVSREMDQKVILQNTCNQEPNLIFLLPYSEVELSLLFYLFPRPEKNSLECSWCMSWSHAYLGVIITKVTSSISQIASLGHIFPSWTQSEVPRSNCVLSCKHSHIIAALFDHRKVSFNPTVVQCAFVTMGQICSSLLLCSLGQYVFFSEHNNQIC